MRHKFWVKAPVLPLFDRGKDLEVRTTCALTENVRWGDEIIFNEQTLRRVVTKRPYRNFPHMLQHERPERILPGCTREEVLLTLRGIYSPKAERNGVVVIELAPNTV